MASYFQDPAQTFIPSPISTPDFNAIQQVEQTKQQRYNAGLSQIQGVSSYVSNSKLTSQENIQARAQFLKQADEKLKNLGQVDLSISQNVADAENVYKPITDDQDIQADMLITKHYDNEMGKASRLYNSKDPDERAQYWDLGVQDLQDGQDQLRTARRGDGSIQKVDKRRYVPKRNIEQYLADAAKDQGLEVTYTSGGDKALIYTYKNGAQTAPNYKQWAIQQMGTNFDDMFAVMGRSEMKSRTRPYLEMGLNDDQAKKLAAQDYMNKSKLDLNTSLTDIDLSIKELEGKKKLYVDDQGRAKRQEDVEPANALKQQIDQLNAQKSGIAKSLGHLNDSAITSDTYNQIQNFGDGFFGNLFKDRLASNFATAYSGAKQEVTVKNNEAYQNAIKNDLDFKKYQLDVQTEKRNQEELDAKIQSGFFTKKGTKGTKGSGSGSELSDEELASDPSGLGGQYLGINTIDPGKVENPYKAQVDDLRSKYLTAKNTSIDGLGQALTMLNIEGIGAKEASTWASGYKNLFENPDQNSTPESYQIGAKVFDYLKAKGYKVREGKPSTILVALKEEFAKQVSDIHDAKRELTPEQIKAVDLINVGDQMEAAWSARNKLFKGQMNQVIASKYGDSPLVKKNSEGNYEVKTADEIASDFPTIKATTNDAIVGVGAPLYASQRNVNYNIPVNYTPKQLAEKYLSGDLKINSLTPTHNERTGSGGFTLADHGSPVLQGPSTTTIPGSVGVEIDGKRLLLGPEYYDAFAKIKNKYGEPGASKDIKQKINTEAGQIGQSVNPNGFEGHDISYNVRVDKGEESTGYRLVREVANPANRIALDTTDKDEMEKYSRLLATLQGGGKNMDYLAGTIYHTNSSKGIPAVTLKFDKEKLEKDEDLSKNLGADLVRKATTDGLTVYLSPTAKGEVINHLPRPNDFQTYGYLMDGNTFQASSLEKSLGFDYEVFPDNLGNKRKPATKLTIHTKPMVFDLIKNSYQPGKEQTVDVSLADKTPDEVMAIVNQIKEAHINLNNRALSIKNQQNDPTYVGPKIF